MSIQGQVLNWALLLTELNFLKQFAIYTQLVSRQKTKADIVTGEKFDSNT